MLFKFATNLKLVQNDLLFVLGYLARANHTLGKEKLLQALQEFFSLVPAILQIICCQQILLTQSVNGKSPWHIFKFLALRQAQAAEEEEAAEEEKGQDVLIESFETSVHLREADVALSPAWRLSIIPYLLKDLTEAGFYFCNITCASQG